MGKTRSLRKPVSGVLFKTVVRGRGAVLFNFFLHWLLYYDYLKSTVEVVKLIYFFYWDWMQ